ncbi:MAG TPA: imidazolonepropionase, partial [Lautropia sp.]|nr:imidazolonepropionase [Lautropia sp.]
SLATMEGPQYGAVEDGVVAVHEGRIAWAGARKDAPSFTAVDRIDGGGGWLTPGLIDCHTHLVHGGNRAAEFELRLQGASYEEIARAGGGILSTVAATRQASEEELLELARPRLATLAEEGVTTVEIKSGYGLDTENELKMLRVARRLGEDRADATRVVTTLLAAHALPPEFAGRKDDYIDEVCDSMIPAAAAAGLADAVDAFCEGIAFSPAQCGRVFEAARRHGLPVKLHADQLSNLGGAALVARHGGLSADHIEYADEAGVAALAAAGTVAVLLPGAFYFLRETQQPPVAALRRHGVQMALATDFNPGSSPLLSPLLAMNMACTLFRLTPAEALAGFTVNAAAALGLTGEIGRIAQGLRAELALWDVGQPAELAYMMGSNPLATVVRPEPVAG